MNKYQKWGENDVHMQVLLQAMKWTFEQTMDSLANRYDVDVAHAAMATAFGAMAGRVQALYDQHRKECERCDAHGHDFHELVLKNFNLAFAQAKREEEGKFAEAAATADTMLANIFKGHKDERT